jgi:hypothetical protein
MINDKDAKKPRGSECFKACSMSKDLFDSVIELASIYNYNGKTISF